MIRLPGKITVPTPIPILAGLDNEHVVAERRARVCLPEADGRNGRVYVYAHADGLSIRAVVTAMNQTWRREKRRGYFALHGINPETGQLLRGPLIQGD